MHPIGKALLAGGYFFVEKFISPLFYGEVGDVIRRFRKSQGPGAEGIAHFGQEFAGSVTTSDVFAKVRSLISPQAPGVPSVPLC